ncbi:class I SAM-dependent methyltransferase [Paenibacillus sp. FSL M7-0896]|uniref:class I SAM-dependent methyltransferase n=1 Tax=Paenibacillus sp. FSL M7-0896 TaxID=2921610 RepID=UPI0030DBA7BE
MNRDELFSHVQKFSEDQYSNEHRLNARIQLYQYCEHKKDWHEWVFEHLRLIEGLKIAEIGCGTGVLWEKNMSKVPSKSEIVLTDASRGMIETAKGNIHDPLDRFHYEVVDAEKMPWPDHSFEVLIANHLLYHFQDHRKIFSEINRVLVPSGMAYASTVSANNYRELLQLILEFDGRLSFFNEAVKNFNLENGQDILGKYFKVTAQYVLQNDIVIQSAAPLILYVASYFSEDQLHILTDRFNELCDYLQGTLERSGALRITNRNVLFQYQRVSTG